MQIPLYSLFFTIQWWTLEFSPSLVHFRKKVFPRLQKFSPIEKSFPPIVKSFSPKYERRKVFPLRIKGFLHISKTFPIYLEIFLTLKKYYLYKKYIKGLLYSVDKNFSHMITCWVWWPTAIVYMIIYPKEVSPYLL